MIPKIIHYCWYGKNQMPPLYERCVEMWHDKLPDYHFQKWDESNTSFNNIFLHDMLKNKKWAFISDYIRLRALYVYGGVYLDCDMEVVKSFNSLLDNQCFVGEELLGRINTGVIGAVKGHEYLKLCMEIMLDRHKNMKPYLIAPEIATLAYSKVKNVKVLPPEYFYPFNSYDSSNKVKNFMYCDVKKATYTVHHWGKTWNQSFYEKLILRYDKFFGTLKSIMRRNDY